MSRTLHHSRQRTFVAAFLLLASSALAGTNDDVVAYELEDCEGEGVEMYAYDAIKDDMASYMTTDGICANIGPLCPA